MKKVVALVQFIFSFFALSLSAQKKVSPEAETFFKNAMATINPKHINWIKSTSKGVIEKNLSETELKQKASQWGVLGSLQESDIEALAFLVLMQASKSAQEDLKAIMAKVKSINSQKEKMRDAMNKLNSNRTVTNVQLDSFNLLINRAKALQKGNNPDSVKLTAAAISRKTVTKKELDTVAEKIQNDLDSLSEMGEQQQLKMQLLMDRMTKADTAASNSMKKFSDTQSQIIQNLK